MLDSIEDLILFFEKRAIPVQITVDTGVAPTVHAIYDGNIHDTTGLSVADALMNMRSKLFK